MQGVRSGKLRVSQESCLEPPKGVWAPEPGAVGCVPGWRASVPVCRLRWELRRSAAAAVPPLWLLLGAHGHE